MWRGGGVIRVVGWYALVGDKSMTQTYFCCESSFAAEDGLLTGGVVEEGDAND